MDGSPTLVRDSADPLSGLAPDPAPYHHRQRRFLWEEMAEKDLHVTIALVIANNPS